MLILDKLCGGQLMILRSDVISSGTETCNQLHGVSLGETLHPVLTQLCPRKQPNWAYCKLFWELQPVRPLSPKRFQIHHPICICPKVTWVKVHWKGTFILGPGGLPELLDVWINFHLSVENFKMHFWLRLGFQAASAPLLVSLLGPCGALVGRLGPLPNHIHWSSSLSS